MKVIDTDRKPAPDAGKQPGRAHERIRQDKFSTLHLPCFLSDLSKGKS